MWRRKEYCYMTMQVILSRSPIPQTMTLITHRYWYATGSIYNKETTTLINNGKIVFANYADIRGNCQVI